jgi:putative oxidoreductase
MKTGFTAHWQIVVRWLLGVLMLWAAVSKLANPTEFLAALYSYELPLPQSLLQVVAVMLPWVELLCGLALLANLWTETVLVLATALFVIFIFATGQAWARGLDISCGCFKLGLSSNPQAATAVVGFFESATFAFFRAIVLALLSGGLLRKRIAQLDADA